MFRSNSSKQQTRIPRDAEPTVIGAGAVIEGVVKVTGRVQLDGRVDGKLEVEGEVSIGPNGHLNGELVADQVAVGGTAEGRICVHDHLHIISSGTVRGEVRYDTLQVDRGGVLDGNTAHGDDSQSVAPEPEPVRVPTYPPPAAN